MKKFAGCIFFCLSLSRIQAQPTCDNEDFENGPTGVISTSTSIQGWEVFKLNYSTTTFPNTTNCTALTSTAVTKSNPTHVMTFTNGVIDTIIGANYPVYSVFGSGTSNGGEAFNPEMPVMKGNSFIRLGEGNSVPYMRQSLEKTITVSHSNALFRLAYMVVMQKGQGCCDAPSFQVKFFNASAGNTLISCPSFSLNAPGSPLCPNPGSAGMVASTNPNIFEGYYQKWKVLAVDLTPYIGSVIVCKIASAYCLNGCSKFAYAYIDAQCSPMEVFVNNLPFPAHTNSVTFKGCGISSATVVAPPDFSSYQWTGPAGFTSTLSTITTTAAGVYTLNISAMGTCSTITKYVNVVIYPAPTVSVSSTRSVICKGESVKIEATGLTTYSWNVPGSTASITVKPASTFTYNVSGVDANGCPGSASMTQSVNPCLTLSDAGGIETMLTIFPNPNQGKFTIKSNHNLINALVTIKDLQGRTIHEQIVNSPETIVNSIKISAGIYLITIKQDEQLIGTGRLVIEKP